MSEMPAPDVAVNERAPFQPAPLADRGRDAQMKNENGNNVEESGENDRLPRFENTR